MSADPREHAPVDEHDITDAIEHVKRGLHPVAATRGAAPAAVPDHVVEAAVRAAAAPGGNPVGKANWAAIIQAILAALAAVAPFIPKGSDPNQPIPAS